MNCWADAWKEVESKGNRPERINKLRTCEWRNFKHWVEDEDANFAYWLVKAMYDGDAILIKGVFSEAFMRDLQAKTVLWTRSRPQAFHRMVEGSPDFHRVIDLETGKNYAFRGCKHSAYFYRWNDDPLGIWPEITDKWRIAKIAMGLKADEYERNTPKDGVVDRIQVVRYPPSIGYLEPHADPYQHQRCFFSVYMSKRGVDYSGGGFYFVDKENKVIEVEDEIDVGDVCLGHANLLHGVAPCDRHLKPSWEATNGRWFLSLYSNASDVKAERHTGRPVRVRVEGVYPKMETLT